MKRADIYKSYGVRLEDRYIVYELNNKKTAIPYAHIACVSLSDNLLIIQTDSVERLIIKLDDKQTAEQLFEDILTFIERLYIR
ncbi:hypothetical protein [Thermocrinis sp.]